MTNQDEMRKWRKILNTPLIVGDIVKIKYPTIFADFKRRPLVMILVEQGTVFKVVGFHRLGVIIENEKHGKLLAIPKELELIGHEEESKEDVEEDTRTRRRRHS